MTYGQTSRPRTRLLLFHIGYAEKREHRVWLTETLCTSEPAQGYLYVEINSRREQPISLFAIASVDTHLEHHSIILERTMILVLVLLRILIFPVTRSRVVICHWPDGTHNFEQRYISERFIVDLHSLLVYKQSAYRYTGR